MTDERAFRKYLTVAEADRAWGGFVLDLGMTDVPPGADYPAAGEHPVAYRFDWASGRRLPEHQLVYISSGRGVFESAPAGVHEIERGTLFVLHPGIWHRYRPDRSSGWTEWWVGLGGPLFERVLGDPLLDAARPVVRLTAAERIASLFEEMIAVARHDPPGCQQLLSGMALHLVGLVGVDRRGQSFRGGDSEEIVRRARDLILEVREHPLGVEALARRLGVGHSWLRRAFKAYTGLPPGQFHLQVTMHRAERLVALTELPLQEIAERLGFGSSFYFSRLFKRKTGLAPRDYRRKVRQGRSS